MALWGKSGHAPVEAYGDRHDEQLWLELDLREALSSTPPNPNHLLASDVATSQLSSRVLAD